MGSSGDYPYGLEPGQAAPQQWLANKIRQEQIMGAARDEQQFWDRAACVALTVTARTNYADQAANNAAELADALLVERRKRQQKGE